jgi:hypothetical protein
MRIILVRGQIYYIGGQILVIYRGKVILGKKISKKM